MDLKRADTEIALCGVSILVFDLTTGSTVATFEIEDYRNKEELEKNIEKVLKEHQINLVD